MKGAQMGMISEATQTERTLAMWSWTESTTMDPRTSESGIRGIPPQKPEYTIGAEPKPTVKWTVQADRGTSG